MTEEQAWIALLKYDGNHRVEPMKMGTEEHRVGTNLVVTHDGIEWRFYDGLKTIEMVQEMITESGERLAGYYIASNRQDAVQMAVTYAKSKIPGLKKLAATTLSKIAANQDFIKQMEVEHDHQG